MARLLSGREEGPLRGVVALNAGAALYVAGEAGTLADGFARAREVLASDAAARKLDELRGIGKGETR